jgi:hypothetical protein
VVPGKMKVAMSSPKVAFLQAELHTAHKTAAKQQAEIVSIRAYYKQQLDIAQAQLQQQRQATATAQVASAGKAFSRARLAARLNSLRAQLQEIKHKHQAATAEATALRDERAAALQACADESMHHRATKAALDVSVKELQASHAELATLHTQLSSACKELKQQKQKATAALAAVQQGLSNMTQRMQLNRQTAAKASAAANASRFAAARTAAQHHTLKEELEQVRRQRDAAAALACDLSTQLQQANAGQQVAEHALAAHRRLHSAAITAMALAWNHDSCSAASSPAAHPAAVTSPNGGCPSEPNLHQDSSDGLAPATPPRRTVSWCQSALSVLKLSRDWVGGFGSGRRRGSEGGFGGSTGSNSSSRDASSGGS